MDRQGQLDAAVSAQLGEAGWLGGFARDNVAMALAIEEFAAACASSAAFVAANTVVARVLATFGNDTQKGELLAAVVRGQTTVTFASIDPDNLGSGVLETRRHRHQSAG